MCEHFEQVPKEVVRRLTKELKETKYRLRKAREDASEESSQSGGPSGQASPASGQGGSPGDTTTGESSSDDDFRERQRVIQEYLGKNPW